MGPKAAGPLHHAAAFRSNLLPVNADRVLLSFVALLASACGQDAAPAPTGYPMPMTAFGAPGFPGLPAPAPAPLTAAAPGACLLGRWQATDFLQMIRRALAAQLRGEAQLTRASGTIGLEFRPPDPTGQSMLVVTANDLVKRSRRRSR